MDIFERATNKKLRFQSGVGLISVEDLWDLPLTSPHLVSLDDIARAVNRGLKASEEESFVEQKTERNSDLSLQMDVVKRVIEVRLADRDRAEKAAATRAKKQQILGLIEKAENAELEAKGVDELRGMLDSL